MDRSQKLLARKERLGRAASYRTLEDITGVSRTAIRSVLVGEERPFPINRAEIMEKVDHALDEIEEGNGEREAQSAPA